MARDPTIAALVLAGGASRRMGHDKRTLRYNGGTFLNRAVETARSAADEVWLLVDAYGEFTRLRSSLARDVNVAVDRIPRAGPMSALAGALPQLNADAALLLSVDYPLLSPAFLRAMIAHYASLAPRPRVLVPKSDGRWHVTCAIYAASLAPPLARVVDRGERSLWRWVASMPGDDVGVVDAATWGRWGAQDVLTNVNTPTDHRRLVRRSELRES